VYAPARARMMTHAKIAVRSSAGTGRGWVYAGSHNLSNCAWGSESQPKRCAEQGLARLRVSGAVQCSAVQCSAVQCSAVQCSAVQCSAAQRSGVYMQLLQPQSRTNNSQQRPTRFLVHICPRARLPARPLARLPACPRALVSCSFVPLRGSARPLAARHHGR
jgi:hypothetical protein